MRPDLAALFSRISSMSWRSRPALAATVIQAFAHRLEARLCPFERRLVSPDHEGQSAALSPRNRPRAGGVEKIDSLSLQGLADLPAGARADGAGVGDHASGPRALDDPVRAQND